MSVHKAFVKEVCPDFSLEFLAAEADGEDDRRLVLSYTVVMVSFYLCRFERKCAEGTSSEGERRQLHGPVVVESSRESSFRERREMASREKKDIFRVSEE